MAEFGPRVFHALANCVNDDLETIDPKSIGIDEFEPGTNALPSSERIEQIKNAMFRLVMLRARNALMKMNPATAQDVADAVGIPVNIQLVFHPQAIHPTEGKSEDELKAFVQKSVGVNGISAIPDLVADALVLGEATAKDVEELLINFRALSAACGSKSKIASKFISDQIFQRLWSVQDSQGTTNP